VEGPMIGSGDVMAGTIGRGGVAHLNNG
jgi:hypothetical protein